MLDPRQQVWMLTGDFDVDKVKSESLDRLCIHVSCEASVRHLKCVRKLKVVSVDEICVCKTHAHHLGAY
jgi:hypothetical protein